MDILNLSKSYLDFEKIQNQIQGFAITCAALPGPLISQFKFENV